MAFPVVEQAIENSTNTAGTSHVITLPTATSGQLLLIILDKGSTSATIDAHASLTELLDESSANGLYIAYRWMDGSEPASYTLTSSASTRTASIAYRLSGAEFPGTQAPQIGTTGSGTSATPDPPASAAPGSTKDYLFIAFYGAAGEEADDDTWSDTPPTDYTPSPPRQKSCGTLGSSLGGLIAAAERQLNTGSAQDPGTFAKDVSAAWRSQTIVVHPWSGVAGNLSKTESSDTISAGATYSSLGMSSATFSVAEAADALNSSAVVAWFPLDTYTVTPTLTLDLNVDSTFGVTENADAVTGRGTTATLTQATLGVTESTDVLTGSATVDINATFGKTEASDSLLAGTSTSMSAATFGVTETSDAITGRATVDINATLGVTEAVDTILAGATSSGGMTSATLSKTETSDTAYGFMSQWIPLDTYSVTPTLSVSGGLSVGTFDVTETRDSISAQATIPMTSGTFSVSETADVLAGTYSLSAYHPVGIISRMGFDGYGVRRDGSFAGKSISLNATFGVSESADVLTGRATAEIAATLAKTETSDSITGRAAVDVNATLSVSESADTISSDGLTTGPPLSATFSVTESADSLLSAAGVAINTGASVIEAGDIILAGASIQISAASTISETADTLVSSGTTSLPVISVTFGVTEDADTAFGEVTGGTPIIVGDGRIPGAGRGSHSRRKRILPDGTSIYATESEVRNILRAFYRKKTLDDVKLLPKKVRKQFDQPIPDVELLEFDKYIPKTYQLNTEKRMVQADYVLFLKSIKMRQEEEKFIEMLLEMF